MKTKHLMIGLFTSLLTFNSCTEDEGVDFTPTIPGAYENGFLITNQGNFLSGDATVSYVSDDFSTINNGIFEFHNNVALGDTAQSMAFYNELAYIVLNGSNKIEIVNKNTFLGEESITVGLENPRYITFSNGNGYVTNWGDGSDANDDFIAIIDLATNMITSTIPIAEGPEHIITSNGKIYVSHKGGYGVGNIISVIASDNSVTTINVGDAPDEMVLDASNNIWVVCGGETWPGETAGKIVKIDTTTDTVETAFDFATTEHPDELVIENGILYYGLGGAIYAMDESATALPTTSIITSSVFGLAINNGVLYATTVNWSGPGELKAFNLVDNMEIYSATVGTNAGGIYFN